jgi:hypothetical protein
MLALGFLGLSGLGLRRRERNDGTLHGDVGQFRLAQGESSRTAGGPV